MDKVYQPKVVELVDEIIESLTESGFYQDYEITDMTFSKTFLSEKLTEKFIENGLDTEEGIFTEAEFDEILKHILAGSILNSLKNKGFIDSYEDENTEEIFFLKEEGKKLIEELKKEEDKDED